MAIDRDLSFAAGIILLNAAVEDLEAVTRFPKGLNKVVVTVGGNIRVAGIDG